MAKSRMAGSKLDEPTKKSADAKEALSRSEQHKRARERIGNDPERLAERLSVVDREKYDFGGYTDKEINMALQGKEFGDEDYARLTGKSGGEDKPPAEKPPSSPPNDISEPPPSAPPSSPPNDIPGPGPRPPLMPIGPGGGGMYQNVNQDNDINTTITGSGNTVTNSQDNSVRQYGGTGDYASRYARGLKNQYVLNLLGK